MNKITGKIDLFFHIGERGSSFSKEIIGGITTFLTMSYILAVNPMILGGAEGPGPGAVFTATVLSAAVATVFMALAANLPIALASGMGINAFFAQTVVVSMGYSWETALTAVFLEGIVFILLSFFRIREMIASSLPAGLKRAIAVGIGLFITLVGLSNAGVVVGGNGSVLGLGEFNGTFLATIIGLTITLLLYSLRVPGSLLIGIFATAVIGIPLKTTVIPESFSPVSVPQAPLWFAFDFSGVLSFEFFIVFVTFLFVDMFDTVGTFVGVAQEAGLAGKDGTVPKIRQAFLADAVGTVCGAVLGTSTVTSYMESTAGIAAGARTGLASLVTALLFLVALFFGPLFLLVPSAAVAPALVLVGFLMMKNVRFIDFDDPTEGIPSFLCLAAIPFTYSISQGIVWGVLSYVLLKAVSGRRKEVSPLSWGLALFFLAYVLVKSFV